MQVNLTVDEFSEFTVLTGIVILLFMIAVVIVSIRGIVKEIRKERSLAKEIPMEEKDQGDKTNDQSSSF